VLGTLGDRTSIVYVSPLKALGNDIQKNLDGPLAEIIALGRSAGYALHDIRTAVRTGDTLMPDRRAMMRRPPHILVTTPESLYILLTSASGRQMLSSVETVIVDEIHAVADDKRGSHLALSLERLDDLAGRPLPRIGLSATVTPIDVVAQFLVGAGRPAPHVVQIARRREFDLAIEVPRSELSAVASHEQWDEVYDRVAHLVSQHRSTLVFVNTPPGGRAHGTPSGGPAWRNGCRRASRKSVAQDASGRRTAPEERRAQGRGGDSITELGIDVGTVDLVCQIASTRSISVAVQRIGRSGHWRGATPKARLFPATRDDLIECAALVLMIGRGELDHVIVPEAPLDILAQQIVAACAAADWREEDLFALVRRAYPVSRSAAADFRCRDRDAVGRNRRAPGTLWRVSASRSRE
jgi:ATP-dependent Lhr-like helicase